MSLKVLMLSSVKALLPLVVLFLGQGVRAQDPTVSVTGGVIVGCGDAGVNCFRGIPYAAPPTGSLRWRPPQPVVAWQGTRQCTKFGPVAPQLPYAKGTTYYTEPDAWDEDCLHLNVWSKATPNAKQAVMVWIHGGALTRGAGSRFNYNGAELAKQGVVLVSINYRLGPLGFLAHPELTKESAHQSSGNYGLLDQIQALHWVKQNIHAFGGDPDCVTIFGESAGSWSVSALTASPLAKGLFHRAIGQSGAALHPKPLNEGVATASEGVSYGEQGGLDYMQEVGVTSLAELRALPVAKLLSAAKRKWCSIVVDGWVLKEQPYAALVAGRYNDVPLLLGSNADEATALTPFSVIPWTKAALAVWAEKEFGELAKQFAGVYPAAVDADAASAYLQWRCDRSFTSTMRLWARTASERGSPVFLYHFTRVVPGRASKYMGAYHAAEIGYAFGNLGRIKRPFTAIDHSLAAAMSLYWVQFAKSGDPNGGGRGTGSPVEWPSYDVKHQRYLELGGVIRAGERLRAAQLDFIERTKQ